MSNKKAQLTLFIIIGIILIISTALFFTLKPESKLKTEINKDKDFSQVRRFSESCVEQTTKQAVFYLGFIGGNIIPDAYNTFFIYDQLYKIPYTYHEGNNLFLNKEIISSNILAKYVNSNLQRCTNNFKYLKDFEVSDKTPNTKVTINNKRIIFEIEYEVAAKQEGKNIELNKEYTVTIESRLKEIIDISESITDKAIKDDTLIHWNYLTEINELGLDITAYRAIDKNIIYRITDNNNELLGRPYIYQFAVRPR